VQNADGILHTAAFEAELLNLNSSCGNKVEFNAAGAGQNNAIMIRLSIKRQIYSTSSAVAAEMRLRGVVVLPLVLRWNKHEIKSYKISIKHTNLLQKHTREERAVEQPAGAPDCRLCLSIFDTLENASKLRDYLL